MTGLFLYSFFTARGETLEQNAQGEAAVLCPFPHNKGYETRPSAHVNLSKGVFHCKTCLAEGRFDNGGLSEIGFMSKVYGISYEQAAQIMNVLIEKSIELHDESNWQSCIQALKSNQELMNYLKNERGLTEETIREYQLGYRGDGIVYPVYLYGLLCDRRTYMPNSRPKMRSEKGAIPLLYPFDHWVDDERPTLLVAGENDCLLARQLGFNAVTVTGGEGSFPKMFLGLFKGRDVYIVYDCDDPGKIASRNIAFLLKNAGANVYVVDLGLTGTKEDKDITDFVMKRGYGAEQLKDRIDQAVPYTDEMLEQDRAEKFPPVDLWDIANGKYAGRAVTSRVVVAGKYDLAMQSPSAVEYVCPKAETGKKSPCSSCPLGIRRNNDEIKSLWWVLEDRPEDVMMLVDKCTNKNQQMKNLKALLGIPPDCPNGKLNIKARKDVHKVIFAPDVESENELTGFRAVEQFAYVIGHNLEDGGRYRVYYKPCAHPLDGHRVYMVVDRVEESDNALNTFEMTEEIKESLKVFQGDPETKMKERMHRARSITGAFSPEMILYALDIMYHSPLEFYYNGRREKGYPEGLIIGDTRTGKSSTATRLLEYYGIGNITSVKRASAAGLLGGAEKLPSGGFRISWGTIPRNHKGIVILDEMSGIPTDVIAALTDVRSSGVATIQKIVKGKAPAKTRLLWMSNTREDGNGNNRPISDYSNGVQIVRELVGTEEDIARFDFIMLIPEPKKLTSPEEDKLNQEKFPAYPRELYRNLIYWVWSRTAEQILWEEGVEEYVWQVAQELNEEFDTHVKLFGAEAWKKLARIAVACAGACFSCSGDGLSIRVRKAHVDWASRFLRSCYDNNIFRLRDYVRERRVYDTTNEAVNTLVAGLIRSYPMVIRTLLQATTPFPRANLQAISGLDNNQFNSLISQMMSNYLITATSQGFLPTRRLRLAVEAYRQVEDKVYLKPLSQKGGFTV